MSLKLLLVQRCSHSTSAKVHAVWLSDDAIWDVQNAESFSASARFFLDLDLDVAVTLAIY